MKEENFKILEWDSNFFGFKVAKINDNVEKLGSLEFLNSMHNWDFKLAFYKSNKGPISQSAFQNEYYEIKYIGKRIPIYKKMVNDIEYHENISSYQETFTSPELIELALLSGRQSRYGVDSRITEEKYQELFELWIINSVKRIIADEVLVFREGNRIVGFTTIKIKDNVGNAPLFAVDREYEGRGISFALMRAIETYMVRNNIPYLLSATHSDNKKALKVYERYGLAPQSPEYEYNFWKK